MIVHIPNNIWREKEIELDFPNSWDVKVFKMKGHETKALSKEEMLMAIRNPIGSKTLQKLAEDKDSAVIIFDDLTRPTKVGEIAELVLEEIKLKEVVFICANGAHGTFDREDFVMKLGERIVENYPVFNHNPYQNLDYLGETSFGNPIEVNSEVMSYPLKIAIGSILPHPQFGFGGGAKIILPGVAGIRSIIYNHGVLGGQGTAEKFRELHSTCSMAYGRVNEENIQRRDAEEAARMAKLDFIINVLINTRRDSTHLFAGDVVEAQRKGVEVAKEHYSTPIEFDFDVVVANAYSKANEATIATWTTLCLKEGGTLVLVCNPKGGQVSHYVHGRWGMRRRGGTLYLPPPEKLKKAGKVILFSEFHEKQPQFETLGENAVRVKTWKEVLEELGKEKKRVAVFPDATIQKPF
ncbi:MAG: lactate racemase domain-containing protein [Archaeoglobaceae archaeon]|nr:lactate racemase domain-containing protein [Archaeoglobales archaeon]